MVSKCQDLLFVLNKNNDLQNKITKECIFTALLILMEKKNFKEISITEITKKAGVSRMAFYRNYDSVEGIITNYLDELFEDYSSQILKHQKHYDYESVRLLFSYFRKHEKLITNLANSNLTGLILDSAVVFLHSFSKNIVCEKNFSPEKERYNIEFIAGGSYKVLMEWAKNGLRESDEEMAEILYDLIK